MNLQPYKVSVLASKLILPAPKQSKDQANIGFTYHEEEVMPFEVAEDSSAFVHIETYHHANIGNTKESLFNSLNVGQSRTTNVRGLAIKQNN